LLKHLREVFEKEAAGPARREPSMIEIKRILCPTDLTHESEEALRYAVALARVYRAKLMLCHCDAGSLTAADGVRDGASARHFMSMFESALTHHLGATSLSRLEWEGFVLAGDDPGAEITREAAERRADLIVMRSRRRSFGAALLGSTAETVCRTAPCSVLVTHRRQREWVGASAGDICLERVLVAHDFSDRSELGLQYGLLLSKQFDAELHLLNVLRRPERDANALAWLAETSQSPYHETVRRLQESVLREACSREKLKPVVRNGRPYEEILSYAEENEIDLICMGSDGVDRGLHALFGSNVDRVLRQSPCPVLVARPFKPALTQNAQGNSTACAAD
jgi:nucleotide-binding universal stress UspA family protein